MLYRSDCGDYPPGSLIWPAFKPYYPVVLHCPLSTQKYPEFDYLLLAGPDFPFPGDFEDFDACRRMRGPDLPLVWDINHYFPEDPSSTVWYVVRENGGFFAVPPKLDDDPCGPKWRELNL
jgi:hypothetical protein